MSNRLKSGLLTVLAGLASCLALEAAVRVAESFGRDAKRVPDVDDRVWSVFSPDLGWALRPGYRGRVGGYDRVFDADGHLAVDSRQIRGGEGPRVLFLGDSNTFGVGAPTRDTFVEVVDSLAHVSAINLGVPGYTSYQGRRVLEKYLPLLQPDIVVVSFNFNDKKYAIPQIGPDGPESLLGIYRSSQAGLRDLRKGLEYSHLVVDLRKVLQAAGLLPRPLAAVRVDTLRTRVDPQHYRENLRAIAITAKRAGAQVIFLALRDNPLFTRPITTGIALLDSGRTEDAIANFRFAVKEDNGFSEVGRLCLSRAYRAIGDPVTADSVLVSPSVQTTVFGGRPIHLDSEYNRIMGEVAAEQGAEFVDASPVLLGHPGDFVDYCHFDAAAHHRVGELLAGRIEQMLQRANGSPTRPMHARR